MKATLWLAVFLFAGSIFGGTVINGPINTAIGGLSFNGTVTIDAPALTLPDHSTAPAVRKEIAVTGGRFTVELAPTDTASPPNSFYRIQYLSNTGISTQRTWVVKTSATPLLISDVELPGSPLIQLFKGYSLLTFSGTPVFDSSISNVFKMVLTGNVTTATFPNILAGQFVTIIVCQDSAGAHTFTWPSRVHGGIVVGLTATKCSVQDFVSDGDNLYARTLGVVNQ